MSLDAIGIVSQDIEKSKAFYALLGLELQQEGGPDHFEATTARGVRIMVDSAKLIKEINPDWVDPVGSGVILCFKQDTPDAVNVLYNLIIEMGHKSVKEPWDAFWGQRYASVQDPDGNQIDIFAPLE